MFPPKTATERRMLAGIFIGAFLLITPGLLLFASGWRWNFTSSNTYPWLPTQKVAAIKLETVPRSTTFTVRDKTGTIVRSGTTPWTGINMEPGYYAITAQKEGYVPVTAQQNLRPGQGWQPTHIVLPKIPTVIPTDIQEPATNPVLPDEFTIEENQYCYNWLHPYKHEWKRYCHVEPITRIGQVPNENVIWFHSEHWIGTHNLTAQYPNTTFSENPILIAGYVPETYAYYGIIQTTEMKVAIWHTHPKPALIYEEPAPVCDYAWDFEQNGLFRKCESETTYSEIVI